MTPFLNNMLGKGDDGSKALVAELNERIGRLEEAIKKSQRQTAKLAARLDEAEKRLAEWESRAATADEQPCCPEQAATDHAPATPATTTLYFSAPTPDGVFTAPSASEQTGSSIYTLTTTDGVSGQFAMLDSQDAIATASISLSQFVKPACRIRQSVNGVPRSVTTVEPGTAVCDGGKWKIAQKAVIDFGK